MGIIGDLSVRPYGYIRSAPAEQNEDDYRVLGPWKALIVHEMEKII